MRSVIRPCLSRKWLRALRHDRQRLGVDRELFHTAWRRKLQKILLRAERARQSYCSPGGKRWLTSLRTQLLPALPASGASKVRRLTLRPATLVFAASCVCRKLVLF